MTCLTEEDREEIMYYRWIASGGPETAKLAHEALALASLDTLRAAGFAVLSEAMVKPICQDVEVIEAVVRKGSARPQLIRWQTFNKGWMRDTGAGWVIFDPLAAPRTVDPALAAVVF